jgi:hypothetical protein
MVVVNTETGIDGFLAYFDTGKPGEEGNFVIGPDFVTISRPFPTHPEPPDWIVNLAKGLARQKAIEIGH